ncbi:MAG: porin [Rubrivivax sp.]|nr:porin [Rubrivivax sp.]
MKKSLLALAALTAFAGAAYAQSSVTLFGIVDLNARNVKHNTATGSTSLKTMSQDGIASSRLGFRGVEDLGGGLRAGFWIEGAINPDTGTPGGQTWQRRSTVSLMGGFGELRLGRDYVPDFWNHTIFDPFGTNGVGSSVNVFSALGGATTLVRSNNSIGYFLPSLGGLYGQAMVSAGEGVAGNKHTAGRIGWAGGPVNIAAAFGKTEITSADDWERVGVAGSFRMGPFTLMLQYNTSEFQTQEITQYVIGGVLPFGASTLKASYVKSEGDGAIATRDATQIALGYQYDLSKRTALYGNYASISNKGSATYAIGGGSGVPGAGRKSTGYEVGVRHTF